MGGGRRDLLEQLQPFRRNAVLELSKTGDVASRSGHAFDDTEANRVDRLRKHERDLAARLRERHDRDTRGGEDHVWLERNQFCRVGAKTFGISIAPTEVDPQVSTHRPAQFPQTLRKHLSTTPHLGVVSTGVREYADAPHAFLSARRNRPRRRAPEQRDELAAPDHSITSSARASRL